MWLYQLKPATHFLYLFRCKNIENRIMKLMCMWLLKCFVYIHSTHFICHAVCRNAVIINKEKCFVCTGMNDGMKNLYLLLEILLANIYPR